jgi:hypothetical protein
VIELHERAGVRKKMFVNEGEKVKIRGHGENKGYIKTG